MNTWSINTPIHAALNALTTTAMHLSKNGYEIRRVVASQNKFYIEITGPIMLHGRLMPAQAHGETHEGVEFAGSWVVWRKLPEMLKEKAI